MTKEAILDPQRVSRVSINLSLCKRCVCLEGRPHSSRDVGSDSLFPPLSFFPSSPQTLTTGGAPDVHGNQQPPSHLTTPSLTLRTIPLPPLQYLLYLSLHHFNCQSLSLHQPTSLYLYFHQSVSPSVNLSSHLVM